MKTRWIIMWHGNFKNSKNEPMLKGIYKDKKECERILKIYQDELPSASFGIAEIPI